MISVLMLDIVIYYRERKRKGEEGQKERGGRERKNNIMYRIYYIILFLYYINSKVILFINIIKSNINVHLQEELCTNIYISNINVRYVRENLHKYIGITSLFTYNGKIHVPVELYEPNLIRSHVT